MKYNQHKYIEYINGFAEKNKCHIWLGGSFLHDSASLFSDVDISVYCHVEKINELIYGYGKPVYISYTSHPLGILIVIYEDGVAVDLEIIDNIDVTDKEFFHEEDIKICNYSRNEKVCGELCLRNDTQYQMSRLFHRSLIKFLAGKKDVGVSVANEIVTFLNADSFIDEASYKNGIKITLINFDKQYGLPLDYYNLLCELIELLDKTDCW